METLKRFGSRRNPASASPAFGLRALIFSFLALAAARVLAHRELATPLWDTNRSTRVQRLPSLAVTWMFSSRQRSTLAVMPLMHRTANTSDARASSTMDCSKAYAITGIITFSSR